MQKKTIVISIAATALVLVGAGSAVAIADPFDLRSDQLSGATLDRASRAALTELGGGTIIDAEQTDDLDQRYSVEVRTTDGREVDVDLDENFAVIRVAGDDDTGSSSPAPSASAGDDALISTEERAAVTATALAAVGSGTVTDLDRGDDVGEAWEVEVTLADGTDRDVNLAADFSVIRVD